jgi:glycosyltransferase involved in cell wall biosynthesis
MNISVIIPCFNAAPYLRGALNSVFDQTHKPAQVIVVDDGSSDESAAIAQSFGDEVICLSQPNQGISAARNRGVTQADGEFLAFLDADDLWPCDSLARRYQALRSDPSLSCVFGGIEQFDDSTGDALPARPGRLMGAMLARRSAFDRVGLFNCSLRIGETLDWVARLDESRMRCGMIEQLVLRRRVHAANTVRDLSKRADYLRALHAALHRRRRPAAPP